MTLDGFERGARAAGALAFAVDAEGDTIAFSGALEAFGVPEERMPLEAFIARLGPVDGEALRTSLGSGAIVRGTTARGRAGERSICGSGSPVRPVLSFTPVCAAVQHRMGALTDS